MYIYFQSFNYYFLTLAMSHRLLKFSDIGLLKFLVFLSFVMEEYLFFFFFDYLYYSKVTKPKSFLFLQKRNKKYYIQVKGENLTKTLRMEFYYILECLFWPTSTWKLGVQLPKKIIL